MGGFHVHSGPLAMLRRPRLSIRLLATGPSLCGAILGIFLLVVPVTRSSEINERASERCEELSLGGRVERVRSLAIETLRGTPLGALTVVANVGHAQRPILDPPVGHRLSNGLLAPLTC
jgi:hypothetical protein